MREKEELNSPGDGMEWMERRKQKRYWIVIPRDYEAPWAMPHFEKNRTLSSNSKKKLARWSRKVAFHTTLLPNTLIHDVQGDQLGLGWTWTASLPPQVLKIIWSPKIERAMKICYPWNKEGWQGRWKQQKNNNNY